MKFKLLQVSISEKMHRDILESAETRATEREVERVSIPDEARELLREALWARQLTFKPKKSEKP